MTTGDKVPAMGSAVRLRFEDAQRILSAQPFSKLLNAELVAFSPSETVLEVAAGFDARQQHGYVHGGVVAYAADNVMAFAAGAVAGPGVVSTSLSLQFVRPALGSIVRARAEVVDSSARQVVARCVVESVDADGRPVQCALGQGTFAVIPGNAAGRDV